jgi:hypothetical protein
VGLILTSVPAERRQGLTLAALGAAVEEAMQQAHRAGVDAAEIQVRARTSPTGKIQKLEIEIL